MLVLTRKSQETVVVGVDMSQPLLRITVVEIAGGKVRLGFQADTAVCVQRLEVWNRLRANGQPAVPTSGSDPPGAD
jgi:carbon storage regulator CsrA